MVSTVDLAFIEFIKNTINLEPAQTKTARISRDYLISCISGFSSDSDFFNVYTEHNLKFGSFARHTKIRPLDDIDLMICFSAVSDGERRTYTKSTDCYYIEGIKFDSQNSLLTDRTRYLKHLLAFLFLSDIVPCFYTDTGLYLIPDGTGNWKKTDPRIDNNRTTSINKKHKGRVLEIIRLMKYWNERKVTLRISSYMIECMILSYYEKLDVKENYWVDWELRDLFNVLAHDIYYSVPDPKGLQGDLNTIPWSDREKISTALAIAYSKAKEATALELTDQKAAINKWREIFGPSFPEYGD